jgi:hypothetical protein
MADLELESIPEPERRTRGTPLGAGIDGADRALQAHAVDSLGLPAEDPVAQAIDFVAECRESLLAYRRRVDEAVRARHVALAMTHHREARLWAVAGLILVLAPAAGPLPAAVYGIWAWCCLPFASRRTWPAWRLHIALSLPAIAVAMISLATAGGGSILAALLALVALACPHLHAWLIAPLPDPAQAAGAPATGDLGRDAADTDPATLARLHNQRLATEALNCRVHALRLRLTTARTAAAGAAIAVIGLIVGGLAGQMGALTSVGVVAQVVAGSVIGGWIGSERPGSAAGMAAFGLGLTAMHFLLLASGHAGFQLFTAMWAWGGWAVAGGLLGLAMEVESDAVPQLTS